jgi:hypothetical protein
MATNDIFKFSGPVTVILRAKTARTINGVNYTANQPVTVLENVVPLFDYGGEMKQITNSNLGNLINYQHTYIRGFSLDGIPFSEKISGIIFDLKTSNNYLTIQNKIVAPESADLYLPSDHQNIKDIFIFKDGAPSTATYNSQNHQIIIGDYSNTSVYSLFYSYTAPIDQAFGFRSPSNGYFQVEMFGPVNVNNMNKKFYMRFDSVFLHPVFNIQFGTSASVINLSFSIMSIDKDGNYLAIY